MKHDSVFCLASLPPSLPIYFRCFCSSPPPPLPLAFLSCPRLIRCSAVRCKTRVKHSYHYPFAPALPLTLSPATVDRRCVQQISDDGKMESGCTTRQSPAIPSFGGAKLSLRTSFTYPLPHPSLSGTTLMMGLIVCSQWRKRPFVKTEENLLAEDVDEKCMQANSAIV